MVHARGRRSANCALCTHQYRGMTDNAIEPAVLALIAAVMMSRLTRGDDEDVDCGSTESDASSELLRRERARFFL